MKFHSWEEIIKYFSDDPDQTEKLWDYVAALRGPDTDAPNWKRMLTSLLRGQCSEALDIADTFSYVKTKTSEKITSKLTDELEDLPYHYFIHTADGFITLSDYYYTEMENAQLGELFSKLAYQTRRYNISRIVSIVEEIIAIMYAKKE